MPATAEATSPSRPVAPKPGVHRNSKKVSTLDTQKQSKSKPSKEKSKKWKKGKEDQAPQKLPESKEKPSKENSKKGKKGKEDQVPQKLPVVENRSFVMQAKQTEQLSGRSRSKSYGSNTAHHQEQNGNNLSRTVRHSSRCSR